MSTEVWDCTLARSRYWSRPSISSAVFSDRRTQKPYGRWTTYLLTLEGHYAEAEKLERQTVEIDHLAIEKDEDLKSLYGDSRFTALVVHAKEVAEEKQKAASAASSAQKTN